jgi:hypothetical protein
MSKGSAFRGAPLVALSLLISSVPAAAETRLVRFPPRILAFDPAPAKVQTLQQNEYVWKVPLRWPSAAILDDGADLSAEKHSRRLSVGDVLAETRLQFDDPSLSGAKSYCVAPKPLPGGGGNAGSGWGTLGMMLYRSSTDGQFCLIDKDHDNVAELSVLINDGSPAARQPVAIKPVRFHTDVGVEVGAGDYAQLKFTGKSFSLQIFQQGDLRIFSTFTTTSNLGREIFGSTIKPKKLDDGRMTFSAPNGRYYVTIDKATKIATLEWEGLTQFKLMPVPAEVGF